MTKIGQNHLSARSLEKAVELGLHLRAVEMLEYLRSEGRPKRKRFGGKKGRGGGRCENSPLSHSVAAAAQLTALLFSATGAYLEI